MNITVKDDDAYKALADKMDAILQECGMGYDTYLLHIRTGNIGEENIIFRYGDFGEEYDTDWYEGGELELLGWIRLYDLKIPNNV